MLGTSVEISMEPATAWISLLVGMEPWQREHFKSLVCLFVCLFIQTVSCYAAQGDLKFVSPCLNLINTGIKDKCHHTWLTKQIFE